MKCLCGYNQRPDNVKILKAHLEDCLTTGDLKDMLPLPIVTWRGQLCVVEELEDGEAELALNIEIARHPAGVARLEKKIEKAEAGVQALLLHNLDSSPEEIIEAIEEMQKPEKKEEEVKNSSPVPKKKASTPTTARKKRAPSKKKL
jgi:hypothetical protein